MKTYFDVLSVPRTFRLGEAELEKQFLALSKQLHPDRFAKAPPRERLEAVQATTALNDAYKTLKDPVRRAEYLLKLEGLDIADERGSVKAPPSLLAEMMELNEQLAEARAERADERVRALETEVRGHRTHALSAIEAGFAALDAAEGAARREPLDRIAQALIALRYHARFLEQVDAHFSEEEHV
jgi:molecular chaperone HscB